MQLIDNVMAGNKKLHQLIVKQAGLLLLLCLSMQQEIAVALPEDCSLENVSCVGPVVGRYKYTAGVGVDNWVPGIGFDTEQQAIDAWGPFYENQFNDFCSFTGEKIRDWVDITHIGRGISATTDGRVYEWHLSAEVSQLMNNLPNIDKPTHMAITYGPSCGLVTERSSGLIRGRVVKCPKGYRPNFVILPRDRYCVSNDSIIPDKNPVCEKPGSALTNPINAALGNKFAEETDIDASVLAFKRTYNSIELTHKENEPIGIRWRHTYNRAISAQGNPATGTVYVFRPNGKVNYYNDAGGLYVSDLDITDSLVNTGSGWEYTTAENSVELYDTSGRLISITDVQGNTQTMRYDEFGSLAQVDSNTGESLQFTYNSDFRISSILDHAGRVWGYRYDAAGNLEYVDNPDGTSKQYHYEDTGLPHALTGITDERSIRYATYGYDLQGRATTSYHGTQTPVLTDRIQGATINYNDTDGTRIVTNSNGDASTYNTAVQLGVALVTNISGPGCSTCGEGNSSYQYDPVNNNLLAKTANGVTTKFGIYDPKGQYNCKVEGITAADTSTGECEFDPVDSPDARRTDYTYDSRFFNKITSITEPSVNPAGSKVTSYTYDDFGNRTSETVSGFAPDGQGGFVPVSRATTWQYAGPLNQLSFMDGPRTDVNDVTTYRYYADDVLEGNNRARLKEIEDANSVLIRANIQYSATGRVLSESRPNGLTLTSTYYPGNDRLETLTESDGTTSRVTKWTYLLTGEVETITSSFGATEATTLTFGYDDARRLTRITDGLGNYIEYTLDTEGNRKEEKTHDNLGVLKKQLSQTFDIYNRLDTTAQANETTNPNFAPDGTLDTQTDGNNVVTDYSYDALKRLTLVTQDLGGTDPATANAATVYDYDVQDRLTTVTDPINGNTTYVYDDLGNLLTQTSPDTGTTTFVYDGAGNPTQKTDAKGQSFSYSYDALNRLTSLDAPGTADDSVYAYDTCLNGTGHLCSVTQGSVVADYVYNAFGDITGHQGVAYGYDAAGRLSTMTYPSGAVVTTVYDSAGQVSRVDLTVGGTTTVLASSIQYQPFGPVSNLTYGNGLSLTQSLDTAYRVTDLSAGSALSLIGTQYDPVGNLLQRTDEGILTTYTYDALSRLDTGTGVFGNRDYTHDKNGNRTQLISDGQTTPYSYESLSNHLDSIDTTDIQLDANGNTTVHGARTFTHTAHNRLFEVYDNGILTATYTYNGLGQRVAKTLATGAQVNYHYGTDGQLLAETDAAGQVLKAYVYLNGALLAQLNSDSDDDGVPDVTDNCIDLPNGPLLPDAGGNSQRDTDGDGYGNMCDADLDQSGFVDHGDLGLFSSVFFTADPDADLNGDGFVDHGDLGLFSSKFFQPPGPSGPNGGASPAPILYSHNDHLGTPKVLTDTSGAKVWSATHDPFGQATVNEDVDGNGTAVTLNVRFPGQYYDQETGLHYNWNRYYDPQSGRYLTSDPIGLDGGINPFIYAYANPVMLIDPDGLRGFSPPPPPRPGPRPNFGRPNQNEQGFRNRERFGSPFGRPNQNPPIPRPPLDPLDPRWRDIHEQLENLDNPGEQSRTPNPSPGTDFIEVCDAWACPNGPTCPEFTVERGPLMTAPGSNGGCFCVRTKKVPIPPPPTNWRFY